MSILLHPITLYKALTPDFKLVIDYFTKWGILHEEQMNETSYVISDLYCTNMTTQVTSQIQL